jgi:hypothetical protein
MLCREDAYVLETRQMPVEAPMPTLTQVTAEHTERLMRHVDALPKLADKVDVMPPADLRAELQAQHEFLAGTLIPHMEAVEAGVHQELDRLLSCRLSMDPMEREHKQVRRLIGRLGTLAGKLELSDAEKVELNRVLVKLYSILKVHIREESMYVPILEHNLDQEKLDALVASMDHASRVEL